MACPRWVIFGRVPFGTVFYVTTQRKSHAYGINLAVAKALTDARQDAGMTQESLAAALPFSLSSLNRYLTGRSAIDVEVLAAICAAIGVSELEILSNATRRRAALTAEERASLEATDALIDDAVATMPKAARRNRKTGA